MNNGIYKGVFRFNYLATDIEDDCRITRKKDPDEVIYVEGFCDGIVDSRSLREQALHPRPLGLGSGDCAAPRRALSSVEQQFTAALQRKQQIEVELNMLAHGTQHVDAVLDPMAAVGSGRQEGRRPRHRPTCCPFPEKRHDNS